MTVCIAAVCEEDGEEIVVISTDHMIDVGIGQFEHDIKKYKKINGHHIAMLSGSALLFNELLINLEGKETFEDIKKEIHNNFQNVKKDIIDKQLLKKFGLEEKEIKDIVKGDLKNPFIHKLIDSIAKFKLDTSILLVGFENKKAKISEIQENGFSDLTDIHFHAIGSGQIQSINTLLFQKQLKNDSLKTTIYNVYKSKKNAEVSSGVGEETDIFIFRESGCYELTIDDIKILKTIYADELRLGKNSEYLNNLSVFNYHDTNRKNYP